MAYSTISKPSLHFDNKTYLGSSNAVTVSGLGFQPDWVWVKDRDNGNNHVLVDAVRGAGKFLQSNLTNAEVNNSSQSISAFTSDGFTTGTANPANESASTTKGFMSWNWKAGGGQGSANNDGSINTTYTSANTTAGFSISQYTANGTSGATVGHGLGVVPKMIIVKALNTTDNWEVYHGSLGAEKYLELNRQDAVADSAQIWNDTEPTSSVFSIGNNSGVNTNGNPYIAYCFAEKKGYSKFGKYNGNSNADGTFVYTGFKPAFINIKASSRQESWYMFDNKRIGRNPDNEQLYSDANSTEATQDYLDILSNGFKLRLNNVGLNGSGETYVYMAFAEEPLVANVSNGVPATAR